MLAYGAGDSPTYTIDITPFLGTLCDDLPHNFTLDVAGMGPEHSINDNWYVSGNVQVILDVDAPKGTRTTGEMTKYDVPVRWVEPDVHGIVTLGGQRVDVTTRAGRKIDIEGIVVSGSGKVIVARWTQDLSVCALHVLFLFNVDV